jgi:succinoglycan biosynthesis transport protein ExoP
MKNNEAVEVIDLAHYWLVVRRQFKKILALSLVATSISVLVALSLTPLYSATSTLLIESNESKILSIEEVYGLSGNSSEYFLTQFEILKSRDMAKRVVEALDLVNVAEFNPYHSNHNKSFSFKALIMGEAEAKAPTEAQVLAQTINSFWAAVSIAPVRKTHLVKISVVSRDPQLAPIAANAIANAYIKSQLDAKVSLTQQAVESLGERLSGLKDKLNDSEQKLQKFREDNNLIDVKGISTLIAKALDQVGERLVAARSERLDFETSYLQLKSLPDQFYNSLSSLPFIVNNPLIASLLEVKSSSELKVSELSQRYGPLHPKMAAAHSDLTAVQASLLSQMKRVADGIKNDFAAAKSKENSLLSALNSTKSEMQAINRTEFELADYERNVRSNRTLYEKFFERISETAETETLQTANARIVDTAVMSAIPIKPKKKLIVLLVLVVSLMLGIALAFLLDALDATIKHAEDVDHKLGFSMLGLLPLLPINNANTSREQSPVRAFVHSENVGFKESIRTLRTSLTLTGLEKPVQTLLFTSTVPREGKTTASVNLASAYGQLEKVLLIDADMRRPTVAKQLQLPPGSCGLSNAVAYPERLDECIHTIEDLCIDVMPAGSIPSNPLELLSSKNFTDILEQLKGRYQRIIIDSAPMQVVSDALYLSTLTDGIVYIIKADSTKDKLIKRGLGRLEDSSARILGVVLTQVDMEKDARYGGNYSGYYDTYE